jgi:hypothetical protein
VPSCAGKHSFVGLCKALCEEENNETTIGVVSFGKVFREPENITMLGKLCRVYFLLYRLYISLKSL